MKTRRLLLLLIFTLAIAAASYVVSGRATALFDALDQSQPLTADSFTAEDQVAFWQARVRPGMGDAINLTKLAQAHIRLARETGDTAAYGRAEAALREALATSPNAPDTLATLAAVSISQHEFSRALELAQQAYAIDPDTLQALATVGDAHLELGNYAEAANAYTALIEQAPSPEALARLARLSWLRGNPAEAISHMDSAAQHAAEWGLSGEPLAWYRTQLGDLYLQSGEADRAAAEYRAALQTLPGYFAARIGLGRVAAAEGDLDTAIELYREVVAQQPEPGTIAALGDLYALAGDEAAANQQYDTVLAIEQLEKANAILTSRQMALFRANHDLDPDAAVAIAEAELAARQDIYAYDTLAWALLKAGRTAEAQAAMDQALALGTQDALLFYHAGMIAGAQGDTAAAREHLTRALSLNPVFDFGQAEVARRTLAQLP